jgi:predicted DNA-binding protein YlxM (UPF0122 family)
MAYSEKQWETVRAFYERGFSLAEIAARPEVEIKDRKTISRKANNEGWVKGEKATLVETEIKTKQAVNEIATAKATLNATELDIHNTIVTERMKDEVFFRKASLIVAQTAIKKVQTEPCSMMDLRAAQDLIGKGKENIYGKSPDTAIQINNNASSSLESNYLKRMQQDFEH